jgi:hypothetical protein
VSKRVPAFTDSLASEPQCPMVTSTTAINGINVRRDILSLCVTVSSMVYSQGVACGP